jgi:hypothetical protein
MKPVEAEPMRQEAECGSCLFQRRAALQNLTASIGRNSAMRRTAVAVLAALGATPLAAIAQTPGSLPAQQVEFCSIIKEAWKAYWPVLRRARNEPDATARDRLRRQLEVLLRQREQRTDALLRQSDYRFSEWRLGIQSVGISGQIGSGKILLAAQIPCLSDSAITLEMPYTKVFEEHIAARGPDDAIIVSGTFIRPPEGQIDAGLRLAGGRDPDRTMSNPEYRATVDAVGGKSP